MTHLPITFTFLSLPLLFCTTVCASGIPIQTSVLIQSENSKPTIKMVQVEHFKFTDNQKNALINRLSKRHIHYFKGAMSQQAQLGMNDVPVLDQGGNGSCVTFANTAAMDAIIGQGDYISQICNLALGQYFENNAQNYPSGWDGSFGSIVLNQMAQFGIIPKAIEQEANCADDESAPFIRDHQPMSLEVFKNFSQPLGEFIWQPILTPVDSLYLGKDMASVLPEVKASILAGDRVTLGFLLDISFHIGASGEYHQPNDTWVMTPQIEEHLRAGKIENGHEVIITGFDDNAQVKDNEGNYHQGVLTLRNSWGSHAGDHGDYYMSYDYFLLMTIEAQRIFKI